MKKTFITATFLFVCLFFIFFYQYYKKLSLTLVLGPAQIQESASVLVPVQDQDISYTQDIFHAQASALTNDCAATKDFLFDKNVFSALEPELVPELDVMPIQVMVQDQNFSSTQALPKEEAKDLFLTHAPVSDLAPIRAQEAPGAAQEPALAQDFFEAKVLALAKDSNTILDKDTAFDKENKKKQARIIRVKNNITADMLKYAHWTGTYSPTFFKLSIDDSELKMGQERVIDIENNRFVVSYEYVFMNGYKKGHRAVVFDVDKDVSVVNLTFSWKTKWHILSEDALPVLVEEVIDK